jgi:23S rRNA pseudouridine955/2504/2580 synthase
MTTKTTPTHPLGVEKPQGRFVSEDEADIRLDRWFKRHFPQISHGELQKWLRTGQIRVNGKRAESSTRLATGQNLRLPPQLIQGDALTKPPSEGKRPVRDAEKLKTLILYEDDDVIVLNKPAGLAVQGGTGLKENLDDSLMIFSRDGQTRPKLVHRLDKDTSGVLLIARNDYAAMKLAASFRDHATKKIYWAATIGVPSPEAGEIQTSLIKKGQTMHVATREESKSREAKKASTLYRVVESVPGQMSFVALWPRTGRTHQLRVHLAHIGTPIWGDPLYKGESSDEQQSALSDLDIGSGLHLHARRIIIPHPRKGMLDITAPLGQQMQKTWRCFGFSEKDKTDFHDA